MGLCLKQKLISAIYGGVILLCFFPFVSPAIALVIGITLSLLGLKKSATANYRSLTLQVSIVLMGFGMNLTQVITASKRGLIDTTISVILVMSAGVILTKLLRVDSKTGILISAGTAICGGSAIAAIASIIAPKNSQLSFSLAVIFLLNAIALLIFPPIGHYFDLSQETFGTWAAIAIHDTSSVVGAGATYGTRALEVATTVKLIRALWIIPLSIVVALFQKEKSGKIKIPWFIAFFVASIAIAYLIPSGQVLFTPLSWIGKRGMVIAIFLIGSNISLAEAKDAGLRSFALGILLWILIGTVSLMALTF